MRETENIPPGRRNVLDGKIMNLYLLPVAEVAKCFDDTFLIKHPREYNTFNGLESVLSCVSSDLYFDAVDSHRNRS